MVPLPKDIVRACVRQPPASSSQNTLRNRGVLTATGVVNVHNGIVSYYCTSIQQNQDFKVGVISHAPCSRGTFQSLSPRNVSLCQDS